MESDNTPCINSLGANPELIHQVALTTRLLQAHPTVNSSLSPGTQASLNQHHSTPSGIRIKSSHAHFITPLLHHPTIGTSRFISLGRHTHSQLLLVHSVPIANAIRQHLSTVLSEERHIVTHE